MNDDVAKVNGFDPQGSFLSEKEPGYEASVVHFTVIDNPV